MGHPIAGSSAVIAPDGRILSASDTPSEQLIIADLDLSLITKARTFADASGHCKQPRDLLRSCWLIYFPDSRPDMLWLGCDDRLKSIVRREV
jgi:nitrilase